MTPRVELLEARDIDARRKALLKRANMSVRKMRKLAAQYSLDQEHQAILRQIEELDFLAGTHNEG